MTTLGLGKTLKIIPRIKCMEEMIPIPKELLEKIVKKMESIEGRINKMDRLAKEVLRT